MGLDDEATLAATRLGRIVVILLVAWVLQSIAGRLIRTFRKVMARRTTAPDELRRIDTVGTAIRYFATVVVTLVAGMLILGELGISIAPILATAGVAGVAIGFGAQSLIRDYFTGFFLLLEDQVREGDVVEIAGKAGEVEEVTLRYIRLRDAEGAVHFIPNGEVKMVTNRTRQFAHAIVDASVAGPDDVDKAMQAMRDVSAAMRQDPKYGAAMLADLDIWGVDRWELWGMTLRGRIKTLPKEKDGVRREFMRRLAIEFAARGVKNP